VLTERYLERRADGSQETPEEMLWRVSTAIAAAEPPAEARAWAERFYRLMAEHRFLPNSPTLMNAGRDNALQYSACYVLPLGDSLSDIFETIKRAALIHQSGGGTGFAFSRLRPRNARVGSTGGRASGPVSFLRVFNAATEAVKQGGTRRGANMGVLRVDHPDILEFVDCKRDGDITNFNLSVGVTDAFWAALESGQSYEMVDPASGRVTDHRPAAEVFQRIVEAAWQTGDPGLIFLDRINRSPANPTPHVGQVEATNPCGEQPLLPNEACNLGSLNLAAFTTGDDLDWPALEDAVRLSVRFLDDVIEVNPYPLPEIHDMVRANRRIGLGVMGWADVLVARGLPYDSPPALELAERVMAFVQKVGHQASEGLAEERGSFPNWSTSIYRDGRPLRNSTVTTVAPTGTISILAGCSSGIEPLFALAFTHKSGDRTLRFTHPTVAGLARRHGFEAVLERIETLGSVHGLAEVPVEVQRLLATAHELSPEAHVRMQAAFQRHTDNGVSKTINLRHEATPDDVAQAYRAAWDMGCLGITVFRDGSKAGGQVLTAGSGAGSHLPPRPRRAAGQTLRVETPLGTAFVTVNQGADGEPLEVFANVGKAGSDTASVSEAIGRLISLALRLPSPWHATHRLREIVDQLSGIGGARSLGFGERRVRSLPDGIAQVLSEYLEARDPGELRDLCPECGSATFVAQEGCQKCLNCGYSLC
jgi:ribonucleoside-diphosphate reductase alpha chain